MPIFLDIKPYGLISFHTTNLNAIMLPIMAFAHQSWRPPIFLAYFLGFWLYFQMAN